MDTIVTRLSAIGKVERQAAHTHAIIPLVGGVLAVAQGGFSDMKDTMVFKLGPLEVSAKEKEAVNVPVWAGVGAIVIRGLLLVVGGKKG